MPETNEEKQDKATDESLERWRTKANSLESQLDEAKRAIADFRLKDAAVSHFREKEGVADPLGLAELAMRDVTLKDVPVDELSGRLDGWYDQTSKVWGPRQVADDDGEEPEPSGATEPPRVPAFAAPNPGGQGTSPQMQQFGIRDPEVRQLVAAGDKATLKQWRKEGRIQLSPQTIRILKDQGLDLDS